MALWTVSKLLDHIQELIGEPVGGFYNISQRLTYLSQAQLELVDETVAIEENADIAITAGTSLYNLPSDFMRFGTRKPYFTEDGDTETAYQLTVVPAIHMDSIDPAWRTAVHEGTPRYLVQEGETVFLYPEPDTDGTLSIRYIVTPTELVDLEQIPFDGREDLNRYAPALAYKVAFMYMLPRAPQLAQYFEDMYVREERKMRHFLRSNPQKTQSIYPTARWSDTYAPERD